MPALGPDDDVIREGPEPTDTRIPMPEGWPEVDVVTGPSDLEGSVRLAVYVDGKQRWHTDLKRPPDE